MAIRWTCPNGCAAVLGPMRPPRDAVVRFCLHCSASSTRLVPREPTALLTAKAKKEAAKREREAMKSAKFRAKREEQKAKELEDKIERAEAWKAAYERVKLQHDRDGAPDYHVTSNGRPRGSYDELKPAIQQYHAIRKAGVEVTLTRVKWGRLDTGCFHGRKFVGWETEDGKRIARHE